VADDVARLPGPERLSNPVRGGFVHEDAQLALLQKLGQPDNVLADGSITVFSEYADGFDCFLHVIFPEAGR
jgi:hypothetical protein